MIETPLARLQAWYRATCNGDWEHQHGIAIETLDNPGWHVRIDVAGTELANSPFERIEIQRDDENDWMTCWAEDSLFQGTAGPGNLEELLGAFLDWASASPR